MAQKAGLWQKLTRKGSNQHNCGFIVGCYESVGLNIEQTKVSSRSLTPPDSFHDLLYVANSPSLDTPSETAGANWWSVWSSQGKVSGKRRRGRPKTSYSSNITKWTSESTERITRETRDRTGWRRLIRYAARAADHHSWWDRERRRIHWE